MPTDGRTYGRTDMPTDVPTDGPTDGTLIDIKGPGPLLLFVPLAAMVKIERRSEAEVLFHHNVKLLSQAIELLIAQHSEELHYYKNFDFAKRYTIQLDEKTIPDYNAPVYVLRDHTYATNEEGRKTIYYQFDFYHFEQGYLRKPISEAGNAYAECRLISGKEIQDKKKVNVLAADLAKDVREYRKGLAERSRVAERDSDSE